VADCIQTIFLRTVYSYPQQSTICSQIETFSLSLLKCNYKVSLTIWFLFMVHLFFIFFCRTLKPNCVKLSFTLTKRKQQQSKKENEWGTGSKDKGWKKEIETRKVFSYIIWTLLQSGWNVVGRCRMGKTFEDSPNSKYGVGVSWWWADWSGGWE
jgi:hypothetical protein